MQGENPAMISDAGLSRLPPPGVRMQRVLSGPWVPGSGVTGQALAVAPDGKLLFSGGHWDGSLRVTELPRGKLLSQLNRHLGMSSIGVGGVGQRGWAGVLKLTGRGGPFCHTCTLPSPCRRSDLPCTGHLWHLPYLRLPGYHVHGVAAPAAGVLGGSPVGFPRVCPCNPSASQGFSSLPSPRQSEAPWPSSSLTPDQAFPLPSLGCVLQGPVRKSALVSPQGGLSVGLAPKPEQVLYGHEAAVSCVALSTELDLAVSGSEVRAGMCSWGGGPDCWCCPCPAP